MKKLSFLLTILLLLSFAFFAIGSSEDTSEADDQGSANVDQSKDESNLGDYHITIDSCRLAEDFEGKPVVIVKYTFKNVSNEDAVAFYTAVSDSVFQNGVGLNEAYFLADNANYSADNATKEIKKGASIEVEVAYELNDTTTDIEVEVEEFISFNDKVVKKTFKISK